MDKNQIGQTNIGNGRLTEIAVTTPSAFASPVYQVSRVTFKNTQNLSPFSVTYRNRVYHDQGKLQTALNKNRADSECVEVLANVFPGFLFAVAAFVSWTTMMRFVKEERTNIGTLKALGYSNGAIAIKFLLYSTSAAILDVIWGISFGYTFLPDLIIKAYLASSKLGTGYEINFAWGPLLISLLVALISTTVISIFTLHQTLREQPSALLLPKPPKNGSRILLEHWSWLWNHMSFSAKVTARNIFRYKSRMLMTIIGVAGCTGLLVMGFGIRDSLQGIGGIQYSDIQKNDVIALRSSNVTKKEQNKLDNLLKEKNIKQSNAIQYQ